MSGEPKSGCACWANDAALGHPGHCCFLRDDRDQGRAISHDSWRADTEVCHIPEVAS